MQKSSWADKLARKKGYPKIVQMDAQDRKRYGKGTMVIPSGVEVDRLMRKVKPGKLTTISRIQQALADKFKATIACPMTTGIFAWIAAHAAQEALDARQKTATPYWRTLKSDGSLNAKYPGGEIHQARMLRAEGHIITRKGQRLVVSGFEKKLQTL